VERCVCIHGHFYQPPRENPWLEAIEIQDTAHPYHDWNERITAECYAPNSASRIVDEKGCITDIVSNYSRISFNFGPTLLSWLETSSPEVYQAIIEADRQSIEWRAGHGNAIAQCYNHMIMPLANKRDKETQIIWGIRDFEHRFGRFPEGMWLPETAVDIETLELLSGHDIKFTILAPRQAWRARKIGTGKWRDVSRGQIDPTRAYLCKLASGRTISIFFYDGPISQAVAFERLLNKGEDFAARLLSGFSFLRNWPQILSIATDGETYGHHHRFGEMALAYALHHIETAVPERMINFGEYLEKNPPTHEVQILVNTSWSCIHGIERWRSDCGCSTGGNPGWNQGWRHPLRLALDWLRGELIYGYEHMATEYLEDPWRARDEYIGVILDRSEVNIETFLRRHAKRDLDGNGKTTVLKLLEMQRHAMLMYTSCGWFFDEISGIETIQILCYAGRALQLAESLFHNGLEAAFIEKLRRAKSNIPEYGDGARIYEEFVRPSVISLEKVAVHYAISSLFEEYPEKAGIYCYEVEREDYQILRSGRSGLAVGKLSVVSNITRESEIISVCVFHLGSHAINGGARTFLGDESFFEMKHEMTEAFGKGDFAEMIRLMDHHFGMHNFSLKDLFRDEQRKILDTLISATLEEFEASYRRMYENNNMLMGFLKETELPIPRAFRTAAEFILNLDLKRAFSGKIDEDRVRYLISELGKWNVTFDAVDLEFTVRYRLEEMMTALEAEPLRTGLLNEIISLIGMLVLLPVEINLWETQNIYFKLAGTIYGEVLLKARAGDGDALEWTGTFRELGQMLSFNVSAVLPEG